MEQQAYTAPASFDTYITWATDQIGISLHDGVRVIDLGNNERGLLATKRIPAGAVIARLPVKSLLTQDNLADRPELEKLLDDSTSVLREDDRLALLLLYEQSIGDRSKYYEHVISLPKVRSLRLNVLIYKSMKS
jgi:hypothetical protein